MASSTQCPLKDVVWETPSPKKIWHLQFSMLDRVEMAKTSVMQAIYLLKLSQILAWCGARIEFRR